MVIFVKTNLYFDFSGITCGDCYNILLGKKHELY